MAASDSQPVRFTSFLRLIAAGNVEDVTRRLVATPALASATARIRETRDDPGELFLRTIAHYVYGGDTALHVAAAAFNRPIAELLVAQGADVRAKNRRGAEPLHYAADTNHWDPVAQAAVIEFLIAVGADPNARDKDGTAPLHRAVRTRSLPAVRALVAGGASPTNPNGRGSTPLDLAGRTTGRGGSGSAQAREQQAGIIRYLLER
jgi:ankyrin repeat protein